MTNYPVKGGRDVGRRGADSMKRADATVAIVVSRPSRSAVVATVSGIVPAPGVAGSTVGPDSRPASLGHLIRLDYELIRNGSASPILLSLKDPTR
jgi:hypothetical protein